MEFISKAFGIQKSTPPPNSASNPFLIIDPTIGFLNLQGTQATRVLEQDRAALTPLFQSHQISTNKTPKCQVLFIYCSLDKDGQIMHGSAPIRPIIKDAGAYIAIIATENSPDSYKKMFGYKSDWKANMVMAVDRKGENFPKFFKELFSLMFAGNSMPTAWVKLAQQIPGQPHPDAPEAIMVPEVGYITLQIAKAKNAAQPVVTGMTLECANSQPIKNATESDIIRLFTNDRARGDFAVLTYSEQHYVQVAGEGNGPYTLECRIGDKEHHFRCPQNLSKSAAQSAFLKYLHRDPTFKTDFSWEKVDL